MIGIFGGTFDPVHHGHLSLAEQVLSRLPLDHVDFLPCANPVHREQPMVDAEHRFRMLQIALEDRPNCRINRMELDRGGPSYTVDSLSRLKSERSDVLCLLIGVDAFNLIKGWKSPKQILALAHLVVCRRPHNRLDRTIFSDRQVSDPALLLNEQNGFILTLDIDENHCSSTEVRRLLASGDPARSCLAEGVSDYIFQHKLYETHCD